MGIWLPPSPNAYTDGALKYNARKWTRIGTHGILEINRPIADEGDNINIPCAPAERDHLFCKQRGDDVEQFRFNPGAARPSTRQGVITIICNAATSGPTYVMSDKLTDVRTTQAILNGSSRPWRPFCAPKQRGPNQHPARRPACARATFL